MAVNRPPDRNDTTPRLRALALSSLGAVVATCVLAFRTDAQVVLDMPPAPSVEPVMLNDVMEDDLDPEAAVGLAEPAADALWQHRDYQLAVGRLALQRYAGARSFARPSWYSHSPAAHVAAYRNQFTIFGRSPGFFTPHGLAPPIAHPFGLHGDVFPHWPWSWHWHGPWHGHWHWHPDWWFVSGGFFAPQFVIIPPRHGFTVRFKTGH